MRAAFGCERDARCPSRADRQVKHHRRGRGSPVKPGEIEHGRSAFVVHHHIPKAQEDDDKRLRVAADDPERGGDRHDENDSDEQRYASGTRPLPPCERSVQPARASASRNAEPSFHTTKRSRRPGRTKQDRARARAIVSCRDIVKSQSPPRRTRSGANLDERADDARDRNPHERQQNERE